MSRLVYGYKLRYSWIQQRANELGVTPYDDPEDKFGNMLTLSADVLRLLSFNAGLARQALSIFLKDPDLFVWVIASTDPDDKLPERPTDPARTQKLKEIVGTTDEPNWWRTRW